MRLAEHRVDEQSRAFASVLGIDWQDAPFPRCLGDHALLD